MPLPDELIIYPGHGAGSACGKNMSKETVSTLGVQKQTNYALSAGMGEEEFIKELTTGLGLPPAYFPMNVRLNREGYDSIEGVLERGLKGMQAEEFADEAKQEGVLVLDTRKPQVFAKGFVPGALFIGLDGQFAPWVGALIPVETPLLLVTDEGREEEAVTRLARIGYDNTLGYLKGGIEAWQQAGKPVETVCSVSAEAFAASYAKEQLIVFDVRREGEYAADHIETANLTPLDFLEQHLPAIPKEEPFYLHCAGGYRSMIAASILKSKGWENFIEIAGGFAAIKKTTIPRTASTSV
jgi:hydroxyacylglutathione hydrolase